MFSWINFVASACVGVVMILSYHFLFNTNKIGYVRTGIILQKYKAMELANSQFMSEVKQAQGNVDTLKQRALLLKQNKPKGNLDHWGYEVGIAEKEFQQYQSTAESQLQARKAQLTKEVIEKVNSYIDTYREKHNYELILGATSDGSILSGNPQNDLTETILRELNTKYEAKN